MANIQKIEYNIDRVSKKFLPALIILQIYYPIITSFGWGKANKVYSYIIYAFLAIFGLLYFWKHRNHLIAKYPVVCGLYGLMIFYVAISCVKLYYVPSSIFFYQRLVCFCSFLSIGTIFMLQQDGIIKRTLRMWWRYAPWITFLSYPFIEKSSVVGMMFFTFLFLILADCLRMQLRGLTYLFVAFLALFCIYQRMDYIYILAPLSVLFMIRYKKGLSYKYSHLLYHIMMWIPVFFLVLAMSGTFNVLKFNSYIKGTYTSASGENMTDDTRTFLYEEAISSSIKNNYVFFGRTPGYGYDSTFAKNRKGDFEEVEGAFAQRYSEVFVVNMYTWCGVIGLIAWFVFFYWFGKSTLDKAKNRYVRGLVIYVGMFWICDWIGNNFCSPTNYYMMLFVIISICIQPEFRNMTDAEIVQYFKRMLQ